jgi:hypothetical protein
MCLNWSLAHCFSLEPGGLGGFLVVICELDNGRTDVVM